MKIFVISLSRSIDRRAYMKKQLDKLELDFEFVDAIDGQNLSEEELQKYDASHEYIRQLKNGEIACTLSHCKVYDKIISEDLDFALIMEDDLILSKDLPEILQKLNKHSNKDEVIMLFNILLWKCNYQAPQNIIHDYKMYTPDNIRAVFGTQAYIISKQSAQKMKDLVLPVRNCPDDWLWYANEHVFENLKVIFPFPVLHAELLSDIHIEVMGLKNSVYEWLKSKVYKNHIPGLFQLFMFKRRKSTELKRRSLLTVEGSPVLKTYKL